MFLFKEFFNAAYVAIDLEGVEKGTIVPRKI
jgi:hypothetical protein